MRDYNASMQVLIDKRKNVGEISDKLSALISDMTFLNDDKLDEFIYQVWEELRAYYYTLGREINAVNEL